MRPFSVGSSRRLRHSPRGSCTSSGCFSGKGGRCNPGKKLVHGSLSKPLTNGSTTRICTSREEGPSRPTAHEPWPLQQSWPPEGCDRSGPSPSSPTGTGPASLAMAGTTRRGANGAPRPASGDASRRIVRPIATPCSSLPPSPQRPPATMVPPLRPRARGASLHPTPIPPRPGRNGPSTGSRPPAAPWPARVPSNHAWVAPPASLTLSPHRRLLRTITPGGAGEGRGEACIRFPRKYL